MIINAYTAHPFHSIDIVSVQRVGKKKRKKIRFHISRIVNHSVVNPLLLVMRIGERKKVHHCLFGRWHLLLSCIPIGILNALGEFVRAYHIKLLISISDYNAFKRTLCTFSFFRIRNLLFVILNSIDLPLYNCLAMEEQIAVRHLPETFFFLCNKMRISHQHLLCVNFYSEGNMKYRHRSISNKQAHTREKKKKKKKKKNKRETKTRRKQICKLNRMLNENVEKDVFLFTATNILRIQIFHRNPSVFWLFFLYRCYCCCFFFYSVCSSFVPIPKFPFIETVKLGFWNIPYAKVNGEQCQCVACGFVI